ncbi:MAG: hypothetical protein ACYC6Y_01770 [Thermoguttaceae bacterium]
MNEPRVWLARSGGKDIVRAFHVVRLEDRVDVVALGTRKVSR